MVELHIPDEKREMLQKLLLAALDNPQGSQREWARAAKVGQQKTNHLLKDPRARQWFTDKLVLSLGDRVYRLLDHVINKAMDPEASVKQQELALGIVEKFQLTGLAASIQERQGTQIVLNFTGDGGRAVQLPPEPAARELTTAPALPEPEEDDADD